jgi:hypothetical protein
VVPGRADETSDWLEEQQLAFGDARRRDDRAALLRFSTSLGKCRPRTPAASAAAEAAAEARLLDSPSGSSFHTPRLPRRSERAQSRGAPPRNFAAKDRLKRERPSSPGSAST